MLKKEENKEIISEKEKKKGCTFEKEKQSLY